jgi:hypothetical protein
LARSGTPPHWLEQQLVGLASGDQRFEVGHDRGGRGDRPGLARLRRPEASDPADLVHGAHHPYPAAGQVDVFNQQRRRLTPPQPGVSEQQDQRSVDPGARGRPVSRAPSLDTAVALPAGMPIVEQVAPSVVAEWHRLQSLA